MMSQKRENTCLKKVSVEINRKILSLAVKLDVIRRTEEAGERRIVCKALDLAGSQSSVVFRFFFKQKGVVWNRSKRDLLFKLNKYFSRSWQGKMLYIVIVIKFLSLLCFLLIINLILLLKHNSCRD
jgi:hypothetical protein